MENEPSSLYGGLSWRLGLKAAQHVPGKEFIAAFCADVYRLLNPSRRRVVEENLRPLVTDEKAAARKLFANFGRKLVDLWRFEAGDNFPFEKLEGWKHYEKARHSGRGILLATIHLGNWEVGATLFTSKGVPLTVLTAEEPDNKLTQSRSQARSRHNIKTLVVGSDPFSFVPVVQELESRGTVAALIDRPHPNNGVSVDLFGRRILVSPGPAELARASGCAVLPVYVVHGRTGYEAAILPEVKYDRAQLRNAEAKQQFSADLMRAFEPALKQYPDQWYQFVSVWR